MAYAREEDVHFNEQKQEIYYKGFRISIGALEDWLEWAFSTPLKTKHETKNGTVYRG